MTIQELNRQVLMWCDKCGWKDSIHSEWAKANRGLLTCRYCGELVQFESLSDVPGHAGMNSEVTGKSERDRQMEEIPPSKVNPSIFSLLIDVRNHLFFIHNNWPDCFHDACGSCKVCNQIKDIDAFFVENPPTTQKHQIHTL